MSDYPHCKIKAEEKKRMANILRGRSAAEFCFNRRRIRLDRLHEKSEEGTFVVADGAGIAITRSSDGVLYFYPWHQVTQITLLEVL